MVKWRTYSIFISSTFADMQSERDYLKMHVFPLINNELKRHAISLKTIDLRWGINTLETDEESVEGKVLRVCLDEIRRSKPFFLCLLGNRYGWAPSKESLGVDKKYIGQSITSIEIDYGFFQRNDTMGCLFVERNPECYQQIESSTRIKYDDSLKKTQDWDNLVKLKKKIKQHLDESGRSGHYVSYLPKWNGCQFVDFGKLEEIVKQSILNDVASYNHTEVVSSPYYDLQMAQEELLQCGSSRFYIREIVNEIIKYIKTGSGVVAITGEHGMGKRSVYCKLIDEFVNNDSFVVLYHSSNAGQDSRDLTKMLFRWIYQLEDICSQKHANINDYNSAVEYFRRLTNKIPIDKKLLLLIDGVDGFLSTISAGYLTFFPRNTHRNQILVCTCSSGQMVKLSSYHHSIREYSLPFLTKSEAEQIVRLYFKSENKELYPQVLSALLSKNHNGNYCYQSPLWLSIALHYITNLHRSDFESVATLSESKFNNSYDKGLIDYINKKIGELPQDYNILFGEYLKSLYEFYGSFPQKLLNLLSISYDGLDEEIIENIMEAEWDPRLFAEIKCILQDYIAEQGLQRKWKILYGFLKLYPTEKERENVCSSIANLYISKLSNNNVVLDNICYYLFHGGQIELSREYFNHRNSETIIQRIEEELYQLLNVENKDDILNFLFSIYYHRGKGLKKYLSRSINIFYLKEHVDIITKRMNYEGKYENTLYVIDKFHSFLEEISMIGDFRVLYIILTKNQKISAIENLYNKEKTLVELEKIIKLQKIRGPISLLIVPIVRFFDKWKLYKLKK